MRDPLARIASAAARLCSRAGRPRRVRISGNLFAAGLLDAIHLYFARRGASVSSSYWSDVQLMAGLEAGRIREMADAYMPRIAGRRRAFTGGTTPESIDLAIVLFGTPHTVSAMQAARIFPGGADRNMDRLLGFSRRSTENFHGLKGAGIRLVLLDLPSSGKTEELGLDHGTAMETYAAAVDLDYGLLRANNRAVERFFLGRKSVRVTCPRGTDLRFNLGQAGWRFEDCDLRREWMIQVPGGEAYSAPERGTAEGVLISGPVFGSLLRITFCKGHVKDFKVEKNGRWRRVPNVLVEERHEFAEFGVGTNPNAKPIYTGPIFEKTLGTVHAGIGGNAFFGGPIRKKAHRDFLVLNPTVVADGGVFMSGGRWAIR